MRAIRFDGQGARLDRAAPEPDPPAGWAVVRPTCMGIASPDLRVLRGGIPFSGVLGHQFVGVVERVEGEGDVSLVGQCVVGSPVVACGKCQTCRGGLSVHCPQRRVLGLRELDGCFADAFVLPVRNLCALPKELSDDVAIFAEPLSAALHAAQVTRIEGKPYITVLGDGVVGLLAAQLMTQQNASVRLLGRHESRASVCEKWGIRHRLSDEVGRRHDQDVVLECTGTPEGVALAMLLVRPRGKIVLVDGPEAPAGRAAGVDVGPVAAKELELIGARGGGVAEAVAQLAAGAVQVHGLTTRRVRLDDAVAALDSASDPAHLRILLEP